MPVYSGAAPSVSDPRGLQSQSRPHQEHVAQKGQMSEEWYSFVHTPMPIPEALKIPDAQMALEKEWTKLETKTA